MCAIFLSSQLGSSRLLTAIDGTGLQAWDYLPFGELIRGGFSTSHLFTGYERDAETGLDDARARYDSSAMGRFASPDPLGIGAADLTNPQSLNQYAYVMNNPLNLVDPSGLCGDAFDGSGCGGGGFGSPWGEDPGIPMGQGPAHTGSHTPFPIPGQGIDWRNWLFGPMCAGPLQGNPCIFDYNAGSACAPEAPNCGLWKDCPDTGGECSLNTGPAPAEDCDLGTDCYLLKFTKRVTLETDAANKYILTPVAVMEGAGLGGALIEPLGQAWLQMLLHPIEVMGGTQCAAGVLIGYGFNPIQQICNIGSQSLFQQYPKANPKTW